MNVVIVEGDKKFSEELAKKIARTKLHKVVLNCNSLTSFKQQQQPSMKLDVVFLGLDGVKISCGDHVQSFKLERPEVQIVVLTVKEEETCIIKAFQAGAKGYLLKNTCPSIEKELQSIANGYYPISPLVIRKMVNYFNQHSYDLSKRKRNHLTQKEALVMKYLVDDIIDGLYDDEIEE